MLGKIAKLLLFGTMFVRCLPGNPGSFNCLNDDGDGTGPYKRSYNIKGMAKFKLRPGKKHVNLSELANASESQNMEGCSHWSNEGNPSPSSGNGNVAD
jgi:hypothetical protein